MYQGELSYCPVTREMQHIDMAHGDVVLIDDVKFFDYPPVLRGSLDKWPSLDQIMAYIKHKFVFVRHGMLCAVPEQHRGSVSQWLVDNYRSPLERYAHEEIYES
jgi:hypothetical protein